MNKLFCLLWQKSPYNKNKRVKYKHLLAILSYLNDQTLSHHSSMISYSVDNTLGQTETKFLSSTNTSTCKNTYPSRVNQGLFKETFIGYDCWHFNGLSITLGCGVYRVCVNKVSSSKTQQLEEASLSTSIGQIFILYKRSMCYKLSSLKSDILKCLCDLPYKMCHKFVDIKNMLLFTF